MEKSEQLRTQPVSSLILKLSTPAIFSLLCNSINMAMDRMFLAKGVGTLALSAVTVAFGLCLIIQACSQLIGVGASSSAAIHLGRDEQEDAEKIVGNALALSFVFALAISIFGLLFLSPLLKLFGADDANISDAYDYTSILFSGAICFVLAQSMNSIVRGIGYAKRSLLNFLSSIGVNLILDALFVLVFRWGVKGAAFATVIGNLMCAVLAMQFFLSKGSTIKLHRSNIKPEKEIVKSILSIGISGFAGQFALSIVTLVFNRVCKTYGGNLAVAAYGTISTVFMLVYMPMIGLGQGIQPLIGYNYGAGNFARVKETLKKAFLYAAVFCVVLFLLFECFSSQIIAAFGGDTAFCVTATKGFRIYGLMTPFVGMQMLGANFFQYIGKAKQSILLSSLRQMILLIPLLLILPLFFDINGVWAAVPLSDGLSFVVTMLFVKKEAAGPI